MRKNAGTAMAMGVIIAAIAAFVVQLVTDDLSIWAWAIPVGLAVGLAGGAGAAQKARSRSQPRDTDA
jgi:hypothetical protein